MEQNNPYIITIKGVEERFILESIGRGVTFGKLSTEPVFWWVSMYEDYMSPFLLRYCMKLHLESTVGRRSICMSLGRSAAIYIYRIPLYLNVQYQEQATEKREELT
jgi:hypothetical protein